MGKFVYADNAATTRLSSAALEAMMPFLREEYGNASQPYSFSRSPRNALIQARETIAACLNAKPEEIYFTSGGSESDNWALKGCMLEADTREVLITSSIEHHAILHSAAMVERMGHCVEYLPVDCQGIIHADCLNKYLSKDTKLVSVMLSNNEVGTIQPIKELAQTAHDVGALFHTDAVQSVGHIPVDVKELGVDMLSASAHKFNGPKGIGFLYIKKGTNINSYIDGGAQEYGRRAGTENIAAVVGMAAALEENCKEMMEHQRRLLDLEKQLLAGLQSYQLDFIRNGAEKHVPGNISLSIKGVEGEMLLHRLDLMGICVSTGSACDSKNTQISHVLEAMNIPVDYAKGTIRVSLGRDNTEEDVSAILEGLRRILKRN